jgi:hypothetical protein
MQTPEPHPWEKRENPQTYELMPSYGEHPKPTQHVLGIVGGNEVPYRNRLIQVETESELRGITRPNTFCPSRKYQPLPDNITEIYRNTTKGNVSIPIATAPLNTSQFWAYPATLAPEKFSIETCARPEKY